MIFQKNLLEEMLGPELAKMHFLDQPMMLRTKYADHAAFRAACGFENPTKACFKEKVDLSWQESLSKPAFKYGQLIEWTIYGGLFNGVLRQCLKNGKKCEETLRYGSLGVEMQKIYDALEEEREAALLPLETPSGGPKEPASAGIDVVDDADPEPQPQDSDDNDVEGDGEGFIGDDEAEARARWKAYAARFVKMRTTLLVAPISEKRLVTLLRDAGVLCDPPGGSSADIVNLNHGIVYNCKTEGEAKTQPNIRLPTHRPAYLLKTVSACLKALSGPAADDDPDKIVVGESRIYFFLDAYKHSNTVNFLNAFTSEDRKLDKLSSLYYIPYEWSSMQARRLRVRATAQGPIDAVEHMTVVTQGPLKITPKTRLDEVGSNQCNFIGPVVTECAANTWALTFFDKKRLLGDARTPSHPMWRPSARKQS